MLNEKRKLKGSKYPSIKVGHSRYIKLGLTRLDWSDLYHLLLTLSWPWFLVFASGFFVLVNVVFALAYLVQDGGIKLARDSTPVFALSLSIMHPIDKDSPLYGIEPEQIGGVTIIVTLSGFDETSSQTVHSQKFYYANDIYWGKRFADIILTLPDGQQAIDFTRFHDFAP